MHYKLIIIFVLCGAGISAAPAKRQNPGNNDQSEVADFRRLLNIFVRLLEIALPKKGENGSQSPTATPQRRQDEEKRSDEKGLSEAEMDAWNSFLSSQNEDNEKQEVSEDTIKPDTYTPLESKKKSEVIEEMIKPETYNALGGKKRSEIVEEPIIEQEYAKPLGSDKRDDESDTAARELLELRALQALKRFAELKKN
ncbi:uncharacterized protein LOC141902896 isoform X3 [Tubulanus polymorphus]|uniref:uncharacterized protein LOC141902896 isoform X3 n=1 Tax=Tubulanus polymorphus TaxID=672921 RepID=UPI003DA1FABB